MEENKNTMQLDTEEFDIPLVEVKKPKTKVSKEKTKDIQTNNNDITPINCLQNKIVIVRYLKKNHGIWGNNPKHVFAGGMAENSVRILVVPRLSSGMYVNVLTDNEKAYLEEVMGLEYNALSVYKKKDNFWDSSNPEGINKVRLTKDDTRLDLSNPEDYIRYKILLANKNIVAPSLKAYQDMPKATYQFVLITEDDETKVNKDNMSITMQCYKEFGKVEDDFDTLRFIVEIIEGKPLSNNTKLEFLQSRINNIIQTNNKIFLSTIKDELLSTKVFIKKCINNGLISNKNNLLYLKSDGSPLCELGEESTLSIAAKYLSSPKHQELKFALEAKLK